MRRSAASLLSNIAEGCGRDTQPQLASFLNIAVGLASELEYQIILSIGLEFINQETYRKLLKSVTEIKRMLSSLIKKVRADS